jgi:hypothetical protein
MRLTRSTAVPIKRSLLSGDDVVLEKRVGLSRAAGRATSGSDH